MFEAERLSQASTDEAVRGTSAALPSVQQGGQHGHLPHIRLALPRHIHVGQHGVISPSPKGEQHSQGTGDSSGAGGADTVWGDTARGARKGGLWTLVAEVTAA